MPPFAEQKTLHLASPYVGAGLTTAPFTLWNGLPISITGQVNHIFPTGNTLVSFGNPAVLSQSFFERQSITEAKVTVTVPFDPYVAFKVSQAWGRWDTSVAAPSR